MKYFWFKTVFAIAAIFSFRLLGLFLLIPVFTLFANQLQGATPALIGLALGAYGLTQGLLQMPFGLLSDKWGRKPIITLGLVLFACGSLVGALSDSIYGMILARILQGTGAIGSVLIALLADLTPDDQRVRAMAVIGMTIALSFALAMVLGPAMSSSFGLAGIFYSTAVFAVIGLLLLHLVIPNPPHESNNNTNSSLIAAALKNPQLQRLNVGIFCQHFILTSTFFAIPLILKEQQLTNQWHFYLPLMFLSFIFMLPFIVMAEKKKLMNPIFRFSVFLMALSQLLLSFAYAHWLSLYLLMCIYFTAFNLLEAALPSLVSKEAGPHHKGTAMGVYSTGQFLGIFAGGSVAGLVYTWGHNQGIFIVNALVCGLWLLFACKQPEVTRTTLSVVKS